ncbi:MAG: membrane protein insertion efficiency factor YidD [Pseudomonadales bacterium]|nr:membrane protein insertion efficiency factor YidD [Pseudomonadales bacterium]
MMSKLLIGLVKLYCYFISPLTKPSCRFYPTCSSYAIEAIEIYGATKGGFLALRRILKCHPFHSGGIDLVPEKGESCSGDCSKTESKETE